MKKICLIVVALVVMVEWAGSGLAEDHTKSHKSRINDYEYVGLVDPFKVIKNWNIIEVTYANFGSLCLYYYKNPDPSAKIGFSTVTTLYPDVVLLYSYLYESKIYTFRKDDEHAKLLPYDSPEPEAWIKDYEIKFDLKIF
jgi:hypothetical protein